jgi:hypothetical protein
MLRHVHRMQKELALRSDAAEAADQTASVASGKHQESMITLKVGLWFCLHQCFLVCHAGPACGCGERECFLEGLQLVQNIYAMTSWSMLTSSMMRNSHTEESIKIDISIHEVHKVRNSELLKAARTADIADDVPHARAEDSVQIEPLLAECRRRCIAAEAALYRSEAECGRLRQSAADAQPALQEGCQAKVGPLYPLAPREV